MDPYDIAAGLVLTFAVTVIAIVAVVWGVSRLAGAFARRLH